MLHIWQSILLAASPTNLGGILSEPVVFFQLKILLYVYVIFSNKVMFPNKKKMNKCHCWNHQTSAFTNYRTLVIFLFRQKRNLITWC